MTAVTLYGVGFSLQSAKLFAAQGLIWGLKDEAEAYVGRVNETKSSASECKVWEISATLG